MLYIASYAGGPLHPCRTPFVILDTYSPRGLAQTIQHTAKLSHHIRTTEYQTWTRGFSFTTIRQSIASSGNSPGTGKWATNYASSPPHLKRVRTRSLQLNMGMAQRHHIQILVFLTPVEIISQVPIPHTEYFTWAKY